MSFRHALIARTAYNTVGVALSNASIAANAGIGTTVGTLSVVGGSGSYTYSLTDPSGLFVIAGANLNVAAALTAGSYPITVTASGGVPTPVVQVFSIAVTPVAVAPANTAVPVISGGLTVGNVLTTTNGSWTGTPAPIFTYQWKNGGANIAGATSSSYTSVAGDVGAMISVTVTATNSAGNASATAAAVGPIASTGTTGTPIVTEGGTFIVTESGAKIVT